MNALNAYLKGSNDPRKMDRCFWSKLHFNRMLTKMICILISFMKWQHFQNAKEIARVMMVFESAYVT